MTNPDDKLIKSITHLMEEYGMLPHFTDNYPAMDVLQIVKDAGYSRPEAKTINVVRFIELFKDRWVVDYGNEGKRIAYHEDPKEITDWIRDNLLARGVRKE
jgi:hypothetical protein